MDNRKISEKQKKIYKFNIIDFVLVMIILAAVAVLLYVMLGNNLLAGKENTTIIYTIEIDLLKNELVTAANQITPGTKITDSVRGYEIGEVQSVKITDATQNRTDLSTGVVSSKPFPNHSKVIITVKAKCVKEKARYVINGKTIMVGVAISFRTPNFISYGTCTYMEIINEDGSKIENTGTEIDNTGDTEVE